MLSGAGKGMTPPNNGMADGMSGEIYCDINTMAALMKVKQLTPCIQRRRTKERRHQYVKYGTTIVARFAFTTTDSHQIIVFYAVPLLKSAAFNRRPSCGDRRVQVPRPRSWAAGHQSLAITCEAVPLWELTPDRPELVSEMLPRPKFVAKLI